jgi:YHS domain-containing protein
MFRTTALALAFTVGMIGTAFAGDQYVDKTGFAVSGYDVVSYFALPQSQIGQPQQSPLPGSAAITAEYNGATFAFATEANRDAFLANPAPMFPNMTATAPMASPRAERFRATRPCGGSWMASSI